ncbi:hypothetical protein A1355_22220 [Methylomonas koyamae]|uniref:Uncharacterized protein n=1 Tax=Methylomonas koyamae TaxID=702114 RepID=A0A177NXY0_9GAMM|nr:hypothetical protein A1355_22220 [Methylomonas koyamae]
MNGDLIRENVSREPETNPPRHTIRPVDCQRASMRVRADSSGGENIEADPGALNSRDADNLKLPQNLTQGGSESGASDGARVIGGGGIATFAGNHRKTRRQAV